MMKSTYPYTGKKIIIHQKNPNSTVELVRVSVAVTNTICEFLHVTGEEEYNYLFSKSNEKWTVLSCYRTSDVCNEVVIVPHTGYLVVAGYGKNGQRLKTSKENFLKDFSKYKKSNELNTYTIEWL